MKKQLICCFVTMLFALSVSAQVEQNDSIARAKIKEIKLNGMHLYADAVSSNGFDEAGQMALEELRISVATELAGMQKEKAEIDSVLKQVDVRCTLLQYRNMNMYKAFAYVKKSLVTGEADSAVVNHPVLPADEATIPSQANAVEAGADSSSVKDVPTTASSVMPVSEQPDSLSAGVELAGTVVPTDTVAAEASSPVVADVVEKKEPAVQTNPVQIDSLIDTRQRVIMDILAMDTYESVMLYLDGMKDDGRLIYGRMNTLRSPSEAYFIIVKDGKLQTVLDRGENAERMNLKTHEAENVQKYKGYGVIWMKVF